MLDGDGHGIALGGSLRADGHIAVLDRGRGDVIASGGRAGTAGTAGRASDSKGIDIAVHGQLIARTGSNRAGERLAILIERELHRTADNSACGGIIQKLNGAVIGYSVHSLLEIGVVGAVNLSNGGSRRSHRKGAEAVGVDKGSSCARSIDSRSVLIALVLDINAACCGKAGRQSDSQFNGLIDGHARLECGGLGRGNSCGIVGSGYHIVLGTDLEGQLASISTFDVHFQIGLNHNGDGVTAIYRNVLCNECSLSGFLGADYGRIVGHAGGSHRVGQGLGGISSLGSVLHSGLSNNARNVSGDRHSGLTGSYSGFNIGDLVTNLVSESTLIAGHKALISSQISAGVGGEITAGDGETRVSIVLRSIKCNLAFDLGIVTNDNLSIANIIAFFAKVRNNNCFSVGKGILKGAALDIYNGISDVPVCTGTIRLTNDDNSHICAGTIVIGSRLIYIIGRIHTRLECATHNIELTCIDFQTGVKCAVINHIGRLITRCQIQHIIIGTAIDRNVIIMTISVGINKAFEYTIDNGRISSFCC